MSMMIGVLLVAAGVGTGPQFSLTAAQPLNSGIRTAYGLLPELGVGMRLGRTEHIAVIAGLSGTFAATTGDEGSTSLVYARLRTGLEFNTGRPAHVYLLPGLVVGYAGERFADYDTLTGRISRKWFGSTGIGMFMAAGVSLFHFGCWQVNAEPALEFMSVPTRRAVWPEYPEYGRYWVSVSSLKLGFVLQSRGRREGGGER